MSKPAPIRVNDMVATRPELVAEHGVVACGHPLAAEAGARMFRQGGNAVDAAIAASFAECVVEPHNCTIGGYARLALYSPARGFDTVDAYARAPGAARADMFESDTGQPLLYYGHPSVLGNQADRGYLAPAVPGAVAGFCAAHALGGRLPLAQVMEPAIELARAGLAVEWKLALTIGENLADLARFPDIAALLLPEGRVPKSRNAWHRGERISLDALAGTLVAIAATGPDAFYRGPVAEAIGAHVARGGGVLSAADLAGYAPKRLRETPARYRGLDYITANDQVGYEALGILARFDLAAIDPDSATFRHLMAEVLAHAFTDNMTWYGDPDFEQSPVRGLGSDAFAGHRAGSIRLDRAAARPVLAGDPWPFDLPPPSPPDAPDGLSVGGIHGTSQVAAADREGNLVAVCLSVSSAFGSCIHEPGTGVLLNNAMRNFDPRPGRPNSIAPGKMPIFAVPTLVAARDGRPAFAIAGSGGYRITTGVLHTLVNVTDFRMPLQAAVDTPRVHCQGNVTYVDGRIPSSVRDALAAMGHEVVVQQDDPGGLYFSRVAAVRVDPLSGLLHAASGPAWYSAAAGV